MRPRSLAGTLLVLTATAALLLRPTPAALAGFTPTPTDTQPPPTTPAPNPTVTPTTPPTTPVPTNTPSGDIPVPGLGGPVINKSASLSLAQVGSPVDFTITVSNQGTADANNVVVVDTLAPELDFVGASVSQGSFTFDAGSRTLTASLGTLAPGQSATITLQTRVNASAQAPLLIANTAELFTDGSSRGRSNITEIQMIPGTLPTAGLPPEVDAWTTALLALLALLAPVAGWLALRRRGAGHD